MDNTSHPLGWSWRKRLRHSLRNTARRLTRYDEVVFFIQRGRRGWSDRDWWSTDYYLVEILPAMLRKYAKDGIGYPAAFGGPHNTKSVITMDDDSDETWEDQAQAWNQALLKAADDIEAFFKFEEDVSYPHSKSKIEIEKYYSQRDKAMRRTQRGMRWVATNFFSLWD